MRLPKHKLPKEVHKHLQTVKHKKSAKHLERLAQKEAKKEAKQTVEMAIDEEPPTPALTAEEKEQAKAERKKANAHKNFYKKQSLAISGKHGPRAINRGSL